MSPAIRLVRVSRPLIDEMFRNGEKEAVSLRNGIPDDYQVFNVEITKGEVLFWFAPKVTESDKVYDVDDTAPVLTRSEK